MHFDIATPSLLFPAISLLLLAYTSRFLGLSALVRDLHARYTSDPNRVLLGQIANLRRRVSLIRTMQAVGVLSLMICVLCMLLTLAGRDGLAKGLFVASLLLMLASLGLSFREIQISNYALNLHLGDIEKDERDRMLETSDAQSR